MSYALAHTSHKDMAEDVRAAARMSGPASARKSEFRRGGWNFFRSDAPAVRGYQDSALLLGGISAISARWIERRAPKTRFR
jgi:hypothetical protein